jgi:hypothetical protein
MVIVTESQFGDSDMKSFMKQERASTAMVNVNVVGCWMKRNEHFKFLCFGVTVLSLLPLDALVYSLPFLFSPPGFFQFGSMFAHLRLL